MIEIIILAVIIYGLYTGLSDTNDFPDKPRSKSHAKCYAGVKLEKTEEKAVVPENTMEMPPLVESTENYIYDDIFSPIGPIKGEDKLMFKMYEIGKKNKRAMTYRALYDKNNLKPYLEEELEQHANSRWWDDDTLEALM